MPADLRSYRRLAVLLSYLDPEGPRTVIALVIGLGAEIAALTVSAAPGLSCAARE